MNTQIQNCLLKFLRVVCLIVVAIPLYDILITFALSGLVAEFGNNSTLTGDAELFAGSLSQGAGIFGTYTFEPTAVDTITHEGHDQEQYPYYHLLFHQAYHLPLLSFDGEDY